MGTRLAWAQGGKAGVLFLGRWGLLWPPLHPSQSQESPLKPQGPVILESQQESRRGAGSGLC